MTELALLTDRVSKADYLVLFTNGKYVQHPEPGHARDDRRGAHRQAQSRGQPAPQTTHPTADTRGGPSVTDKAHSTAYVAGKTAFSAGLRLIDRPDEILLDWQTWEHGWLDAMAETVRNHILPPWHP